MYQAAAETTSSAPCAFVLGFFIMAIAAIIIGGIIAARRSKKLDSVDDECPDENE